MPQQICDHVALGRMTSMLSAVFAALATTAAGRPGFRLDAGPAGPGLARCFAG